MKTIATLSLVAALATAGTVSAQQAEPIKPVVQDPFVTSAGPAVRLPGIIVVGIALTILSVAAITSTK